MGPRVDLDAVEKRKNFALPGIEPGTMQPVAMPSPNNNNKNNNNNCYYYTNRCHSNYYF
jgi:hypothetical protein